MMSRGTDCSEFFADVVKNVASPTLEIKKLVYIYLLQYAESEPDLALLSINTIQKALNDQNQVIRALAIRVMSGIRVPVISQIVALAIKKGVTDMSAYVRKCAALAIPKCYKLDPTTMPQLTDHLSTLLGDKSHYVMGAAVMAFLEICPTRYDLIHTHYRALVKMLIDMDEWGQLALLRLLTGYARQSFPVVKGKRVVKKKNKAPGSADEFYSEDEAAVGEASGTQELSRDVDPDLELLLKACPLLLQSRSSAVIIAVARVYRHLAPPEYLARLAGPLVSLLRASVDIQHIALISIVSVALENAQPFSQFATHFLVHHLDPPHIWRLKLEALTLIFPYVNIHTKNLILSELEYFAQGYDKELIKEAVRAIGRCAQSETRNAARCLRVLLRQVESSDGTLVAESLTVIRHIIQQNPTAHSKTVIRLAKALDTATNPTARASIIWLVGEFSGMDDGNNVAADTLRILAKNFSSESVQAKQQIVLLAAKVYAHHLNRTQPTRPPPGTEEDGISDDDDEAQKHPIALLFSYILLLARYDLSYDLRDRARFYKSLLAVPSSTQLATLLLLAPKPTPQAPSPSSGREGLTLGSAAMVIGKEESIRGYEPLPDWVSADRAPSPSVREPPVTADSAPRSTMVATGISSKDQARSGGYGKQPLGASPKFSQLEERGPAVGVQSKSNGKVETSLEDFLASDDESEDEDEESEEESEEEESEEEDSEDEDADDDDEEDEEEDDSADEKENAQLLGGSK
ncbi:Similar to AP-3 complex subunit beta-2; acc. no. Q13367 [Pyronema omphalodes CBS 100304]|uniref:AP complex subunit beta n=1 Tax=Pyronema omphalodes (strain CBS 100304) TaxID=1076935 RepID=U4L535_PYROM|nr:Similar to AP-3 complex subunit beta-2; acc. no. Q13367 [Pyronema omphalodes CBS 100304]